MKWNIVTDSSCDLFPAPSGDGLIRLASVPFAICVGSQTFVDDETLDHDAMMDAMERERSASRTACPAPGDWLAEFEQGEQTLAITISSQLSGSMNSALAARGMALARWPEKRIAVLDSRSAGPELVLCVEEIERLIRSGLDFDAVAEQAAQFLQKARVLFALSSFDNLVKNGRMGRVTGFVARALGMWGIGGGSDEGMIVLEGKARGGQRAVALLTDTMREKGYQGGAAVISHCDNADMAWKLRARMQELWPAAKVEILPTRGLCSYYADRGGLIVSFVPRQEATDRPSLARSLLDRAKAHLPLGAAHKQLISAL